MSEYIKNCKKQMTHLGFGSDQRVLKKKRVKMAKKYLKKCPLSLAIREIKTKTALRVYLTRVRMPKANKTADNVSGRGYGENGTIIH